VPQADDRLPVHRHWRLRRPSSWVALIGVGHAHSRSCAWAAQVWRSRIGNFGSAHELAPVRLRGRTQELDQLGDDDIRRWAVVLACEHAALGVR
jgi:hypothetical protein